MTGCRRPTARATWATLALAAAAVGCERPTSILAPGSGEAAHIEGLWWLLLAVTGVPALVYIAVTALAVVRGRRRVEREAGRPEAGAPRQETRVIVLAGVAIPAALVLVALAGTVQVGARLSEEASAQAPALTVDVVGHQFWWRVLYPDHGIETANEIHVPAGAPVRLRVTSADVIHSFWVPRLFGKRDMTPGHVTELLVRVDAPGVYRGACYELCGVQHALMAFELVAHPPEEMDEWLASQARPARVPEVDPLARRGQEVFGEAQCAHCHAVRGMFSPGAAGAPGPDLTHLGSRRTLAAATLPNTRGHLAGWVLDPQPLKPGSRMPATHLAPDEMHALLRFLETLR